MTPKKRSMDLAPSALIPAAGLSSRMHQYKPLLPMGATTMIQAAISLFIDAGIKNIIVVTGHNHDRLAPLVEAAGARPVFNPRYETGMFSSVKKGVEPLSGSPPGFFLLPVDIPAIRPSTISIIYEAFEKNSDRLVIPEFNGRTGHPPLIPTRMIPAIKAMGPEGNLRQVLFEDKEPIVRLPVHDRAILMDADTPGAYERIKKKYDSREIPDRDECMSIINQELAREPGIRAHLTLVAETAEKLGKAVNHSGYSLNMDLIKAGALLHDIKRKETHHARAGHQLLWALGFPAVAEIAGDHMTLSPKPVLTEKQIVYFADKLCRGDRLKLDYGKRFRRKATALPHAEKEIFHRFETTQLIHTRIETAASRPLREILD